MASIPTVTPDLSGSLTGFIVPLEQGTGDNTLPPTQTPGGSSGNLNTSGARFDVSVGGVPFLLIADKERPYIRQTAPIQKPQFDISPEAGEQTLDQYWVRSQTSWHRGAGINFYEPSTASAAARFWEPGADLITQYRYEASAGVDVWTRDQATLLHRMDLLGTVGPAQVSFVTTGKLSDGTDCVFTNENSVVKRRHADGSVVAYTPTGTAPLSPVCVAGSSILVGHGAGIDVGGSGGSVLTALWTIAAGATVVPYWVKGRIIAAIGPNLYQLTLTPGGAITSTALLHTHQDPSWVWSAVTDGPAAVYAAGYSGATSSIYKFTLEAATSGTLPKLGQAYEVATMPTGEQVLAVRSYLGGYLGIGTNMGVRVALMDTNGNINYGPLTVETKHPVRSVEGHGSYIYASVQEDIDGLSGAVRINLGQPLPHEDLRFAYAYDAQTHDGGITSSVAFLGTTTRVVLGVVGKGVYVQSSTQFEALGYVLSGRVRYRTVERKAFRLADLRSRLPGGSVALSVVDEKGTEVTVVTLTPDSSDGSGISLLLPSGYHEFLAFRTTLTPSGDGLTSPVLQSLQVKALPAPRRQRLVQLPLNCADREQDSRGVPFGYVGYAWERVKAIEAAEENNVVVQVQDFTNGETFSATIEQSEFSRTFPRAADGSGNFSGTLKLTLRKL